MLMNAWYRYGPEAVRSAGLVGGTAKNIVAVYIDLRGFGRLAIIMKVGKELSKAKLESRPVSRPCVYWIIWVYLYTVDAGYEI